MEGTPACGAYSTGSLQMPAPASFTPRTLNRYNLPITRHAMLHLVSLASTLTSVSNGGSAPVSLTASICTVYPEMSLREKSGQTV